MIFNYIGGGSGKAPTLRFSSWYGEAPADEVATFARPSDPLQEGYVFGGWYSDEGLTQEYDWASEAKAATLHAKWAIAQPAVSPAAPGTYDGSAKALGTVTALGAGQKVEYSVNGSEWAEDAPTATDAGSYTVGWRVTAAHCETVSGSFTVTIAEAKMTVSATGTSTTYNGSPVSANPVTVTVPATGYELRYGTAAGAYDLAAPPSFTDAGEHTVYYRVAAKNYETVTGTYKVTIAKASCNLSLSPTSLTVKEADGGTGTIKVTRTGDGTISATSSDASKATVSVSGATVTVRYAGAGTATVTVSVAATTNYLAGSATCSVKTEAALEIVSWASGTDAQIAAMVAAADAGTIRLSDHWKVGDTRKVKLSAMSATGVGESHVAQEVELVLMNAGGKTLSNGKTCSFIVGQKNCLANGTSLESGYMNSSNTNSGGWESCQRRTWCNSVYYNAIPASLRPIFKKHRNVTANGSGSSTTTSEDYFAMPSEKEVFGSTTYADSSAESANTQFQWYKTSSNRVKKAGASGGSVWWWERSPRSGHSTYFCGVYSSGTTGYYLADYTGGLAPFGCI